MLYLNLIFLCKVIILVFIVDMSPGFAIDLIYLCNFIDIFAHNIYLICCTLATIYRIFPVCPSEYLPGCGQIVRP